MERCIRCNSEGEDRRTLWMACLYEMSELGIPFNKDVLLNASSTAKFRSVSDPTVVSGITVCGPRVTTDDELRPIGMYTLRVCKRCRAEWMEAIKSWFNADIKSVVTGTGVFVRKLGDSVELTEEEVDERVFNAICSLGVTK